MAAFPLADDSELARWQARLSTLEKALQETEEEEARLVEELTEVEAQIGYYESLARDMKGEIAPPNLSGLLSSWRRT
jgi:chromosome segregation ATPase